VNYDLESC